jgi:acyl-CoA synthetase (NDP forming)
MISTQMLIAQIDDLFHPRSVAVVGAPRGMKTGSVFLMALLDQGFAGQIYPVNPRAREINGLKAYPRVADIPGPVDLAIVLVPHTGSLSVVKECAAKGVKGAVLFTAGYKETGTEEGRALEQELVGVARSAGMRLIGPNGMGLYCPKTGLSFFPQVSKDPGTVGIISHSGSLTNILGIIAPKKGICFSKVIS